MPIFVRSFEAPIDFTKTITDGVFTSDITNGAALTSGAVTFTKSKVVDETIFLRITAQTVTATGSGTYLLRFGIFDVTDGESFPSLLITTQLVAATSLSNSVMALSRNDNVTRYIVMAVVD